MGGSGTGVGSRLLGLVFAGGRIRAGVQAVEVADGGGECDVVDFELDAPEALIILRAAPLGPICKLFN